MFSLAILIGIYSYGIFSLGLVGLLYPTVIFVFSAFFLVLAILYFRKNMLGVVGDIGKVREKVQRDILSRILLLFLAALVVVNLVGALGPETGFDALWYHLTLPKLYLIYNAIVHIPGGILYYSDMPKLTEMLYVSALALGDETVAKLIHFLFGALTTIAIYKMGRMYLSLRYSLLASAIFYSNLVVGWMSTTAYIDLARTFFETLALWGLLIWVKIEEKKWLVESAVMAGLAITAKLLAIGSLLPTSFLIIWHSVNDKKSPKKIMSSLLFYVSIALVVPLPWFVLSFLHTGNPVFPFFTRILEVDFTLNLLKPEIFISEMWQLFTQLADPISPIYLISLPLLLFSYKRFSISGRLVLLYSFLALIIWYITPRTGGGRFILPYLPAFSLVVAELVAIIYAQRESKQTLYKILIGIIVVSFSVSLIYRGVANIKYVPVIVGSESKQHFLTNHLNFSFGDFYDTDGYFQKTITNRDRVLLYGFHNLYYVDFPFIDASWVQKGNTFNYIAVQDGELPERFRYWSLIYYNPKTKVGLYSLYGQQWIY